MGDADANTGAKNLPQAGPLHNAMGQVIRWREQCGVLPMPSLQDAEKAVLKRLMLAL